MRCLCWVYGEGPHSHFYVDDSNTETVNDLRKAIKDAKPVRFRAVDANEIQLYTHPLPGADKTLGWNAYVDERVRLDSTVLGRVSLKNKRCLDAEDLLGLMGLYGMLVIAYAPNAPDITLNCWIRGHPPNRVFSVDVSPTRTIGELKGIIRNKRAVGTSHPKETERVLLYRVPDVTVDALAGPGGGGIDKLTPLPVLDVVWDFFPVLPPARRVHIVVDVV